MKQSSLRRIAFRACAAILAVAFGIVFFGLVSLVLAWFQDVEGVAGPVTEPRTESQGFSRRRL